MDQYTTIEITVHFSNGKELNSIISENDSDLCIDDIMQLVKQALLGIGYAEKNIDEFSFE